MEYANSSSKAILEMPKVRAELYIPKNEKISIGEKKENLIIKLLIMAQYKVYKELKDIIKPEDFKNEINRKIIETLYNKYEETNTDIEDFLILFEDENVVNKLSSIMIENEENFDIDKCLQDVIKNFNKEKLLIERNNIIQKLKNPNLSSEETLKLESQLSKILVKIAQSK